MYVYFRLEVLKRSEEEVVIKSGNSKAILKAKPFKIEFYKDETLVAIVNGRGLFTIEHLRAKNVPQ